MRPTIPPPRIVIHRIDIHGPHLPGRGTAHALNHVTQSYAVEHLTERHIKQHAAPQRSPSQAPLANTGAPINRLGGTAVLLGALLLASGVRRNRGRHAAG